MSFVKQFLVTLIPPLNSNIAGENGLVSPIWNTFFGQLVQLLTPLGVEKNFQLENNLAVAADIVGLSFTAKNVSHAVIDFYIQRVTDTNEVVTSGTMHAVYKPNSANWSLVTMGTPGPSTSGITFSITAAGQVQYTSSNVTGTIKISKITWRARTLAAKSALYSVMGGA